MLSKTENYVKRSAVLAGGGALADEFPGNVNRHGHLGAHSCFFK
jgi:hypothetical protein